MSGPGQYLPDATEGITRPEDLPKAKVIRRSRNFTHRPCPGAASPVSATGPASESCTTLATWLPVGHATSTSSTRSIAAPRCRKYFNADMSDYALPKAHYTHRVVSLAVRLVVEDGLPYQAASWHLWRDHRVFVPFATIQNWVEAGGKKAARQMWTTLSRLGPG